MSSQTGMAQIQMQAQGDQVDTVNAETFNIGGNSTTTRFKKYTNLPYSKGARQISVFQAGSTGPGVQLGFTIDHTEGGPVVQGSKAMPKIVVVSLKAPSIPSAPLAWNSYPVVNDPAGSIPWTAALPNGKYAILGAWVNNIANCGLLRFSHADFGAAQPGFEVLNLLDSNNPLQTPSVNATTDELDLEQGWQFVQIGKDIGKPAARSSPSATWNRLDRTVRKQRHRRTRNNAQSRKNRLKQPPNGSL